MSEPILTSRRISLSLAGILALAALLRLWGIGGGLPYSVGVDEPQIMTRAVHMMQTGRFNPDGFYDYPTLSMYLQSAVACVRFIAGAERNEWSRLDQIWSGEFFLWGRVVTACMSLMTIGLVFRSAIRWGPGVALIAALVMAVQPTLTREAHFVLTDTPLTMFVALTLLLSLTAMESGSLAAFALAGAAAGLATATKYNGLFAAIMPLSALVVLPAGTSLRRRVLLAMAVAGGLIVAFLVGAPYTLLDLPGFLNGFAALLQKYNAAPAAYGIHYKNIRNAFAPSTQASAALPALLLCLAGAITAVLQLRRRRTRGLALVLLAFPLAYFWLVSNQAQLTFARYDMPLWPALAIALGVGVFVVRDLILGPKGSQTERLVITAALTAVLLMPAYQSWAFARRQAGVQNAQLAGQWLVGHVNPADLVILESDHIHLPPRFSHENVNSLINHRLEYYLAMKPAYFVVCSCETEKTFDAPSTHPTEVAAYNRVFDAAPEVVGTFDNPSDATTYRVLKVRK